MLTKKFIVSFFSLEWKRKPQNIKQIIFLNTSKLLSNHKFIEYRITNSFQLIYYWTCIMSSNFILRTNLVTIFLILFFSQIVLPLWRHLSLRHTLSMVWFSFYRFLTVRFCLPFCLWILLARSTLSFLILTSTPKYF